MSQKRQPKGIPVGGEFAANQHDEAVGGLQVDLSTQDPVDIDESLATLYYNFFDQQLRKDSAEADLKRASDQGFLTPQREERLNGTIADAQDKLEQLEVVMKPFEDEYRRRDGWTRAFLVKGSDGHVHKSMQCSTCNRNGSRTNFMWVTDYSGKDEEQIVEDSGRSACTVCYPSAPGDGGAESKIVDPEYQAEKEARAAERRAKEEVRAAKGITNPETGGDLIVGRYHIKTSVTAEREAVDRLLDIKRESIEPYPNQEYAADRNKELDQLEAALASKRGESRAETRAYLDVKARKKFAKDYDWFMEEHGVTEAPTSEWSE